MQDAPPVPYRGLQEIERPVDAYTLTQRYTQEAVRFIRESSGGPFFLYIAYNMPHLPVGVPASFQGRSRAGRYGDAIEEIDWSVGQVLDALKASNLDRNTITVFFSDNGPWANATARSFQETQTLWDVGWAGLLRGTKATTWEGGVRVPGIVRWPDGIPAGRVSADIASELDLFPTFVHVAGDGIPRPYDGWVRSHAAARRAGPFTSTRTVLLPGAIPEAVRMDRWKLRLSSPRWGVGARQRRLRHPSCTTSNAIRANASTSRRNTPTSSRACARGSKRSKHRFADLGGGRRFSFLMVQNSVRLLAPQAGFIDAARQ